MRCINDVLPSETLLTTFKSLDTREVLKVREVCKLWLKLVDENRTFSRCLILTDRTSTEIEVVLNQFDEKSGSTLEEIAIETINGSSQDSSQILKSLQKSRTTLSVINLKFTFVYSPEEFCHLTSSLLLELPNLVDFPVTTCTYYKCQLLKSSSTKSQPLQVLWIYSLQAASPLIYLLSSQLGLFNALSSLVVEEFYSHSDWRSALSNSPESFKHLSIRLNQQVLSEELSSLSLPNLEVLELMEIDDQFPTWMVVPPTLKLSTSQYRDLPDLGELWLEALGGWGRLLLSRRPNLQVLRVGCPNPAVQKLLDLLRVRRASVEDGLEVEGVRVVDLSKLVITPLSPFSPSQLQAT